MPTTNNYNILYQELALMYWFVIFFLHFLIILISYRSAGRMLFIGCGPFSQKIGDHGEMMSCILVHVLLLLVFPTLFFAEFRKNNFYAYYSVFQTMFVQPELGCYRHVHVPLLVWGTLILLDSPRHFFCWFQDPVTGIPTWHDRPQSPLVM